MAKSPRLRRSDLIAYRLDLLKRINRARKVGDLVLASKLKEELDLEDIVRKEDPRRREWS